MPTLEDIAAALTGSVARDGTAPMLGALPAVSGTAALPGYTFSADATAVDHPSDHADNAMATNGFGLRITESANGQGRGRSGGD